MFPPATIEALEIFSNSHMANNLQYAAVQVSPYLVDVVRRLRHMSSNLVELTIIKIERDDLRERVTCLKEEKQKFEEKYDLLAQEKAYVEAQVSSLDTKVEHRSR